MANEKLERLLYLNRMRRRTEDAARRRPEYVEKFFHTTGVLLSDDDFLTLEEGDQLRQAAVDRKAQVAPGLVVREKFEATVYRMLAEIGEAVAVREGYLVGQQQVSENVGYPRV